MAINLFHLATLGFLMGCQSRRAALKVICDAPVSCTACMQAKPVQKQTLLSRHIAQRLSNREVVEFYEQLAMASPSVRQSMLVDQLQGVGFDSCPYLDQTIEVETPRGLSLPLEK